MQSPHRVLIGYFRANMDPRKVAALVKRPGDRIQRFESGTKPVGYSGSVSYLIACFDNRGDALKKARELRGVAFRGHQLSIRMYHERTSANERRRTDWRTVPWHGLERRQAERRRYTKAAASPSARPANFIANSDFEDQGIAYCAPEAAAFLQQSIRYREERERRKHSNRASRPTSTDYWQHGDYP